MTDFDLQDAADKLRPLAEAAQHDLETADYWKPYDKATAWRDGFVNGFGGISSDLAAIFTPTTALAIADWLGCLAALAPSDRRANECGWCGDNHALTVARAINGTTA